MEDLANDISKNLFELTQLAIVATAVSKATQENKVIGFGVWGLNQVQLSEDYFMELFKKERYFQKDLNIVYRELSIMYNGTKFFCLARKEK